MSEQNQQLIKNKLWSIAFQDNHFESNQFLTTFNHTKFLPPKAHSFRQISDWSNRYSDNQNINQSKDSLNRNQDQKKSKFSFLLLNKDKTKYQSSLLSSPKKQRLELSPITMKFANQSVRKNLKRQKSQGRQQITKSFYEPLNLLYEYKRRKDREMKQRLQQFAFILPSQNNDCKFPKTQRTSSIMRLMKKNQQIRIIRKRNNNPQKLADITFH